MRSPLTSSSNSPLSLLEQAAIEELKHTPAQLSRLERLLIAVIVELGRLQSSTERAEAPFAPRLERLTKRENDVLRLVVDGHSNKSAALQLGISDRTVEVHRLRILHKVGVRNSTELIRMMTTPAPPRAA